MKRRDFTLLSAAVTAAIFLPSLHCSPPLPDPEQKTIIPAELSSINDLNELKDIGISYRKIYPENESVPQLMKKLFTEHDGNRYKGQYDAVSIQHYLSERVRTDFQRGDLVEINGWILSVTEARQCAYLSLTK